MFGCSARVPRILASEGDRIGEAVSRGIVRMSFPDNIENFVILRDLHSSDSLI